MTPTITSQLPALVSQPLTSRSPSADMPAWLQALQSAKAGAFTAPRIEITGTGKAADVGRTEAVSLIGPQAVTGSVKPAPAIKLNPQLQGVAVKSSEETGLYKNLQMGQRGNFSSPERFAEAFAQQYKIPGTQIGIVGETHSDAATKILIQTADATQKAVKDQGKRVVVALEIGGNPTVDAALDRLNSGKISMDQFKSIAVPSIAGSDPVKQAYVKNLLQETVGAAHAKGHKVVFWDRNRATENGVETVKGNRDQAGAAYLADQAKKNPTEVYVVQAGSFHAQLNSEQIELGDLPKGIEKGSTLANLLVEKAGRQKIFSVAHDQIIVQEGTDKIIDSSGVLNNSTGFQNRSPIRVSGVDATGTLTGATFPTFDAIVPVVVGAYK